MTSNTPMGYCKNCEKNVILTRQDFDTCLAIIFLIFTGGIAFIIYLIIYYSKPKNRCTYCGTVIVSPIGKESEVPKQIVHTQKNKYKNLPVEIIESEKANYCPLCGAHLDERNNTFCPSCGSEI